jgi:hypothetical protein
MTNSDISKVEDTLLPNIYDAIVDYHNNLVQMRFTIAGLCIAATGFLMNSWFSMDPLKPRNIIIPILGFFLVFICFILELRTYLLLYGLGVRGIKIETKLNTSKEFGFFDFMHDQQIKRDFPIFPKISSYFFKKIISHSFAIILLYLGIIIGWIIIFFIK